MAHICPLLSKLKEYFIQIFGLCYLSRTQLDVQSIRILKVFYFHGPNVLSKNAL